MYLFIDLLMLRAYIVVCPLQPHRAVHQMLAVVWGIPQSMQAWHLKSDTQGVARHGVACRPNCSSSLLIDTHSARAPCWRWGLVLPLLLLMVWLCLLDFTMLTMLQLAGAEG